MRWGSVFLLMFLALFASAALAASGRQPPPSGSFAGAPPQFTHFSTAELMRGFLALAFGSDLRIGARPRGVRRFDHPIKARVIAGGSIDRVAAPADQAANAAVEFVSADLTDYASFEHAIDGCDALIHMAAIPSPRGFPDHVVHNNNVVSSYNALSAAARLGITRVCQASSINATGASYLSLIHI